MSVLVPSLCVAVFVGVAVAAVRTQPTEACHGGRRARLGRALLGVVGYPAAVMLVDVFVGGSDVSAGVMVLFGLPGLVFGFLIGRLWITWVPLISVAAWLLIAYVSDPSCATSCGEDDWTQIALTTAVLVVIPAVFSLLLGIVARNTLGTRVAGLVDRSGSATPNA